MSSPVAAVAEESMLAATTSEPDKAVPVVVPEDLALTLEMASQTSATMVAAASRVRLAAVVVVVLQRLAERPQQTRAGRAALGC